MNGELCSILWTTKVFLYKYDISYDYIFTKDLQKGRDKNMRIF